MKKANKSTAGKEQSRPEKNGADHPFFAVEEPRRDEEPDLIEKKGQGGSQTHQQGEREVADKSLGQLGVDQFAQLRIGQVQRLHAPGGELIFEQVGNCAGEDKHQAATDQTFAQLLMVRPEVRQGLDHLVLSWISGTCSVAGASAGCWASAAWSGSTVRLGERIGRLFQLRRQGLPVRRQ